MGSRGWAGGAGLGGAGPPDDPACRARSLVNHVRCFAVDVDEPPLLPARRLFAVATASQCCRERAGCCQWLLRCWTASATGMRCCFLSSPRRLRGIRRASMRCRSALAMPRARKCDGWVHSCGSVRTRGSSRRQLHATAGWVAGYSSEASRSGRVLPAAARAAQAAATAWSCWITSLSACARQSPRPTSAAGARAKRWRTSSTDASVSWARLPAEPSGASLQCTARPQPRRAPSWSPRDGSVWWSVTNAGSTGNGCGACTNACMRSFFWAFVRYT